MSALPTLSLSEALQFQVLGNFLVAITGYAATDVVRGPVNRVAEPGSPNFIVMSPLRQSRLATNITAYADNVLTGSIAETTLTVTTIPQSEGGGLLPGMLLIDAGWPTMNIASGTTVIQQLTGDTGSTGTYQVSVSQTLDSETLYAGAANALVETELTIQLDIHGPAPGTPAFLTQSRSPGDIAVVIQGLFRSGYGVFEIGAASGWAITPLWCGEARQMPFINAESQFEERFVMEVHLQIQPIVGVPIQFFDEVEVTLKEVDAVSPP